MKRLKKFFQKAVILRYLFGFTYGRRLEAIWQAYWRFVEKADKLHKENRFDMKVLFVLLKILQATFIEVEFPDLLKANKQLTSRIKLICDEKRRHDFETDVIMLECMVEDWDEAFAAAKDGGSLTKIAFLINEDACLYLCPT